VLALFLRAASSLHGMIKNERTKVRPEEKRSADEEAVEE
jgi:hypothetical protein